MSYINNMVTRREFLISQREVIVVQIDLLESVRNSYTREITLLQKRINTEVFS